MSRLVPHLRPEPAYDAIRCGLPVSAADCADYAGLANWINGHGAQLIPCAWIGVVVGSGTTETFHFGVAPSIRAVERVWQINLVTDGDVDATATITCATASIVTVIPALNHTQRRSSHIIREPLASKSSTAGIAMVSVQATNGAVTVESIACYEQTRRILAADTTDDGVDLTTCRVRQPIVDIANASLAGVIDAQKDLDARRAGLWHWAAGETQALSPGSESFTDIFGPIDNDAICVVVPAGVTSVTVIGWAKVSGGTGQIKVTTEDADTVTINVTSTTFDTFSGTLSISTAEDLTEASGVNGADPYQIQIEALDPSGETLSIAAIGIIRTTTPI